MQRHIRTNAAQETSYINPSASTPKRSPALSRLRKAAAAPFLPLALLPIALLAGLPTSALADDPPPDDPPFDESVPIIESTADLNLDGSWDYFEHHIAPIDDPQAFGQVVVLGSATGPELFTLTSDAAADLFGASAASAGDWNDDGIQDIAVCAPLRLTEQTPTPEDPNPLACEGAVIIHSGDTGAPLTTLTIPPNETFALAAIPKEGDYPLGDADVRIASTFRDSRGHFYSRARHYESTTGDIEWEQPIEDLIPALYAGDLNYDESVDVADLEVLLLRMGAQIQSAIYGDLNLDGVINAADITHLVSIIGAPDASELAPYGQLESLSPEDTIAILGHGTSSATFVAPVDPSWSPCQELFRRFGVNCGGGIPGGQSVGAPGDPGATDGDGGGGNNDGQNGGGDDGGDDDGDGDDDDDADCSVRIVGIPASGFLGLPFIPSEDEPFTLYLAAIGAPASDTGVYTWSVSRFEYEAEEETCAIQITDLNDFNVAVSYSVTTEDGYCAETANESVIPVVALLHADYDRDGEISVADDDLKDDLESGPPRAGLVTMINDEDADGDGVPNFADGLVPSDIDDDDHEGDRIGREHFIKLELSLHEIPELDEKHIYFSYDGSNPALIQEHTDPETGQITYAPELGGLRIWTDDIFDGSETSRMAEDVIDGGHYVAPNRHYTPEQLGINDSPEGKTITLWAEPIAPTSSLAGLHVQATVAETGASDFMSFTLFKLGFDQVGDNGQIGSVDAPWISFPTPIIESPTIELSDPYFDAQREMILADLTIAGTIDDRVAQLIENAATPEIEVQLNGEPLRIGGVEPSGPITVAASVSHGAPDPSSILEPFPTTASFSALFTGVQVQPGVNSIELFAKNAYGLTGFARRGIQITVDRKDVSLEITSGGSGYDGLSETITATLNIGDDPPIIEQLHADPEAPHIYRGGPFDQFIIELPEPLGGVGLALLGEGGEIDMLDPFTRDEFDVTTWHPDLPGAAGVREFTIVESANDSRMFDGEAFLEDNFLHDELLPIEPDALTPIIASEGGDFYPFMVRIDGPPDLSDVMEEVLLGDTEYELFEHDGSTHLRHLDAEAPRAYLIVPVIPGGIDLVDHPELFEDFPNNKPDWSAAAAGFCAGIGDAVVGIWDGVVEIHSLAVDGTAYVITFDYRVRNGDAEGAIADLKHDYRMAKEKAEAIADVMAQIAVYSSGAYFAAVTGNHVLLNKYGSEMALFAEYAAEIIELAYLEWKVEATDYEVGRAIGRIYGEIAISIASLGVGHISKGATLVSVLQKLRVAPWMQRFPLTLARIDILLIRAQKGKITKMCFVAGTPVHTVGGLRPIESIRAGDLVLSRDEHTGETGFKPVVETFVTHPDSLYEITIDDGSGAETLICTGEHPFYSATAEQFIPAAELVVGDTLELHSDDPIAHITDIQVQRGPPAGEERFTTYNFEVADWHTYFVGASGVWVHNRAAITCEQVFNVFETIREKEGLEDKPWTAWKRTLAEIDRMDVDVHFGALIGGLNRVQRDLYARAANTADDAAALELVRWKRLKDSMENRLQVNYLEVHHVLQKKEYAFILYRRIFDTNADPPQEWLDSMPGIVLPRTRHNGKITTPGEATIHGLIREEFRGETLEDLSTEDILDRFSEAYSRMSDLYGDPDGIDYNQVWSLAERWFENAGAQ